MSTDVAPASAVFPLGRGCSKQSRYLFKTLLERVQVSNVRNTYDAGKVGPALGGRLDQNHCIAGVRSSNAVRLPYPEGYPDTPLESPTPGNESGRSWV